MMYFPRLSTYFADLIRSNRLWSVFETVTTGLLSGNWRIDILLFVKYNAIYFTIKLNIINTCQLLFPRYYKADDPATFQGRFCIY